MKTRAGMNGIRDIRAVFGYAFHIFLGELCALGDFGYDLLIVIGNLQFLRNPATDLTTAAPKLASYCDNLFHLSHLL